MSSPKFKVGDILLVISDDSGLSLITTNTTSCIKIKSVSTNKYSYEYLYHTHIDYVLTRNFDDIENCCVPLSKLYKLIFT